MNTYYQDRAVTIYHGDCREIIPTLPKVELVIADPPYHGVVSEAWDNRWKTENDYLTWVESVVKTIYDIMFDSSSFYMFASPQMSAKIEILISKYMRVLNNIVWDKGSERKGSGGSGVNLQALRRYWTANSERIIFSEMYGGERHAMEASGYFEQCNTAKKTVIGEYLKSEFEKAGVSNHEIAQLFPSKTGGLTGCVSNWLLGLNMPTAEQYHKMREYLNHNNEYEYMRREYEDMRREFSITKTMQWGDIWKFKIEREQGHPTQKPQQLISQMCLVSCRPCNTILDPFMGAGTTLRAAKDLGRRAIGIELDEKYCEMAALRMAQEVLPL